MLDDRGHAGVFDYEEIRKHVRVPYPFEPGAEAEPYKRTCRYQKDKTYTGCGCTKAGPGGMPVHCSVWLADEPVVIKVKAPKRLPPGRR